jgi:segregation and condensation protein B
MSVMTPEKLQCLLEAAMMAYGKPMSIEKLETIFEDDKRPSKQEIREALNSIAAACEQRGVELKEVASGFRFQAKQEYAEWISRLWEEKPPRYSRALLETLALIAYRQPITRSEIEDVRGVSVSSHIIKTLLEREWIRIVGHRDVPGRPALYATTKEFLDYFNLKSLEELPTLSEIRDLDQINAELELDDNDDKDDQDGQLVAEQNISHESHQDELSGDEFKGQASNNEQDEKAGEFELLEASAADPEAELSETLIAEDMHLQTDNADKSSQSVEFEIDVEQPDDERSLAEQMKDAQLSDVELLEEAELTRLTDRPGDDDVFNDAFEPDVCDIDTDINVKSNEESLEAESSSVSDDVIKDEMSVENSDSPTRSEQDA